MRKNIRCDTTGLGSGINIKRSLLTHIYRGGGVMDSESISEALCLEMFM